MKVLFGELNNKAVIKSYTGINTETANTTVDNKNNTIKVDVNTDNIATVDYVNEHIDMFTGEITLSGDEELVLQIQNGRMYHEGELYTGDITFSDDYIVGDVNGDRVINQTDIDTLYEWFAEYDPDTDTPAFDIDEDAADANKDGTVDGKDVTRIRKYINGNPISPTGETLTRPIITLNVNNGITYFEGELYTDTVTLSGDATLYIVYEKGLVKNITTTNPNLDGTVRYDSEQELTDEQKEVARKNIGVDSEISKFGITPAFIAGYIEYGVDLINYCDFPGGKPSRTFLLYLVPSGVYVWTVYSDNISPTEVKRLQSSQIAYSENGSIYSAKDENGEEVQFTIESFEYEGNTYYIFVEYYILD